MRSTTSLSSLIIRKMNPQSDFLLICFNQHWLEVARTCLLQVKGTQTNPNQHATNQELVKVFFAWRNKRRSVCEWSRMCRQVKTWRSLLRMCRLGWKCHSNGASLSMCSALKRSKIFSKALFTRRLKAIFDFPRSFFEELKRRLVAVAS